MRSPEYLQEKIYEYHSLNEDLAAEHEKLKEEVTILRELEAKVREIIGNSARADDGEDLNGTLDKLDALRSK